MQTVTVGELQNILAMFPPAPNTARTEIARMGRRIFAHRIWATVHIRGKTMRTIIALAMLLTASVANAQQVQTGAGIGTCGQFAQDYQQGGSQAEKIYFAWAQ